MREGINEKPLLTSAENEKPTTDIKVEVVRRSEELEEIISAAEEAAYAAPSK